MKRSWLIRHLGGLLGMAGLLSAAVGAGAPPPPSAAGDQQPVTLRFPSWQWGQPGYDQFLNAAIVEFEKLHPNVRIEKITIASASYAADLVKMFAANDPPEIVQFLTQLYYKAVSADWLDPLDSPLQETDIPKVWSP
jgi:ABC-type glycerol-3-phosphate transport system substrate-binding protein